MKLVANAFSRTSRPLCGRIHSGVNTDGQFISSCSCRDDALQVPHTDTKLNKFKFQLTLLLLTVTFLKRDFLEYSQVYNSTVRAGTNRSNRSLEIFRKLPGIYRTMDIRGMTAESELLLELQFPTLGRDLADNF